VKVTNAAAPSTEGCHELPSSFDSIDEVHDRGAVQAIATATVALEPRTGQQATATDSIGVRGTPEVVPALYPDTEKNPHVLVSNWGNCGLQTLNM
jgi:hypothetical protein